MSKVTAKKSKAEKQAPPVVGETSAPAAEKATPAQTLESPAAAQVQPKPEGKLAAIRRLREEGHSREHILKNLKDSDGNPFHKTTVAIQCSVVEKKKLEEATTDEERAKWTTERKPREVDPVKAAEKEKAAAEKKAEKEKSKADKKAVKDAEKLAKEKAKETAAPAADAVV